MSSFRVPYMSFGNVKKRDHFQFNRADLSSPGAIAPGSKGFNVDYLQAMKWLWKVKKWNVSGGISSASPVFDSSHIFGGSLGFKLLPANPTCNFDLKQRVKTVAPTLQPLATRELNLLDGFRNAAGDFVYTRGNFGWVPPLDGFESPPGRYPESGFFGFGQVLPAGGTLLFTNNSTSGIAAGSTYTIHDVIWELHVGVAIQRWDPTIPPPTPPRWKHFSPSQLGWIDGNKIQVAVLFQFEYVVSWGVTQFTPAPVPDPGGIGSSTFEYSGSEAVLVGSNTGFGANVPLGHVTIDGTVFPLIGDGLTGGGPRGTAEFSIDPIEFWPFKNSDGDPVYDTATGAELVDPFS